MEWLTDPQAWVALATLAALEIVLGVDNIIFISILVARLPEAQRARARTLGLGLAAGTRIALLLSITWVMSLTDPLFSVFDKDISGRDLILLGGGLFLLWKSVHEIHGTLEGEEEDGVSGVGIAAASFGAIIVQIAIIDIVFSLDSVITAVGLVDEVEIMIVAILVAVAVMMFAAGMVSRFVETHPTIKMLALSFLVLVGVALVAEGWGFHIPKGYIYFSMAFAIGVEMLNLRMRRKAKPVHLRQRGRSA
ncbi:MAG: Integral rane protein TerC [Betaproteobacteria bacterium]|nr:Integral rane protein TerC [Betaproteobacteria bacterium]